MMMTKTLYILGIGLYGCDCTIAFVVPPTRQSHSLTLSPLYFFNWGGGGNDKKQDEPSTPPSSTTNTPPPTSSSTNKEEPDLVEKMFGFFFGAPEAEPMGLKRFGQERFPEQYPATVDNFDVEPVASDDKLMAMVRPLLKNTNLERRGLQLTFDANRQGWDAYKFHQAVDKKGGALVLCRTMQGLWVGGYNPKGWVGYGEARGSIAAFLFRQNPDGSFTKLRKVGGPGLAQM
jgi:hypothetical protein